MTRTIAYEQAVYGSFPFWHRGYAVLARSARCRGHWLDALRLAGQRFGEPPTGAAEYPCLFAIRLVRGPWMIVGVSPQGCDDLGRPGALAFHGLFVSHWTYRWAGSNPFSFVSALRNDWSSDDQSIELPSGRLVVNCRENQAEISVELQDVRVRAVVEAMTSGRKVVLHSSRPIDDLARLVWRELPRRVRRTASIATWAFRNDNKFDLVAVPRGAVVQLNGSELVLGPESVGLSTG
jgi:hypothetical protein